MSDRGTKELLCELLREFHARGWASGTGGGICGPAAGGGLLVAPTGVHKERVRPEDLFLIDAADGSVLEPATDPSLRPSECSGIFCAIAGRRAAPSVAHSHALSAVLAADLAVADELVVAGFEMLKGIRGVGNRDRHAIPVIANTAREHELVGDVEKVMADERFAATHCILVADHGAYIWGQDLWEAKRHVEVYHWLFDAVVARARMPRP